MFTHISDMSILVHSWSDQRVPLLLIIEYDDEVEQTLSYIQQPSYKVDLFIFRLGSNLFSVLLIEFEFFKDWHIEKHGARIQIPCWMGFGAVVRRWHWGPWHTPWYGPWMGLCSDDYVICPLCFSYDLWPSCFHNENNRVYHDKGPTYENNIFQVRNNGFQGLPMDFSVHIITYIFIFTCIFIISCLLL